MNLPELFRAALHAALIVRQERKALRRIQPVPQPRQKRVRLVRPTVATGARVGGVHVRHGVRGGGVQAL